MRHTLIDSITRFAHDFAFRVRHGGSDEWSVSLTDGVISILKNARNHDLIPLLQVQRISAVSRDRGTRDEVFLVIGTGIEEYWVGEFFRGFETFSEQLQLALPFRHIDWYAELSKAQPFTNPAILLWER